MTAIYRMASSEQPVYISLSGNTLTLSPDRTTNLTFDFSGRMLGAWLDGLTHRRGLDNRMMVKWLDANRPALRRRRDLDPAECQKIAERAYATVRRILSEMNSGALTQADVDRNTDERIRRLLLRTSSWNWRELEADADRFAHTYKPVPILPPDQYLALVLQATEGCSYNQCTFCSFYRDRPFHIKRPAEFSEHIRQVRSFFGDGITVRRSIFLADANAIVIPQDRLLPHLDAINAAFPVMPSDLDADARRQWRHSEPWVVEGIHAFISAPDALHKSPSDFAELYSRNLRRVYVGLETGHDPLRSFVRKPGLAVDVIDAIQAIKRGGLGIGIIVMVGIGGAPYRENHLTDTVDLIRQLPLDSRDLVYLSPFTADGQTPYLDAMQAAGYPSLSNAELQREVQRFRLALAEWSRSRRVRVSHYNVREFIY